MHINYQPFANSDVDIMSSIVYPGIVFTARRARGVRGHGHSTLTEPGPSRAAGGHLDQSWERLQQALKFCYDYNLCGSTI